MSKTVCLLLLSTFLVACANKQSQINAATDVYSVRFVQTASTGSHVALAYSKAGAAVYAGRSHSSVENAVDTAVWQCPYSDCRLNYVDMKDGCVAFAFSKTKGWGRASAENEPDAMKKALKLCNAHTEDDNCKVLGTLCPAF